MRYISRANKVCVNARRRKMRMNNINLVFYNYFFYFM